MGRAPLKPVGSPPPPTTTNPSLKGLADQSAAAVRSQWAAEAGIRGVNDPWPLPVAWQAAPEQIVEEWALLRQLAGEHHRSSLPANSAAWAAGPAEPEGIGSEILRVLQEKVPTRRLVVLGAPGAGKTMLLVRLLLELIEQRGRGAPVPVLFSLSSWEPTDQDLESWLASRLIRDFDELATPCMPALGVPPGWLPS